MAPGAGRPKSHASGPGGRAKDRVHVLLHQGCEDLVGVEVVPTSQGFRLLQGDAVLSEVLGEPGPTHDVFDVLAVAIAALAPGLQVAVLGFAGGGLVAPLRAAGGKHRLLTVDVDACGHRLFREISGDWVGAIEFDRAEASLWLERQACFDLIVDDLSIDRQGHVTKPGISVDILPRLMQRRLAPGGCAVVNLLPVPGMSWDELLAVVGAPWPEVRVVDIDAYENRVLVGGEALPTPAKLSRLLRDALRGIGSVLASQVHVRH